ncbi:myoD family inhibitor domain-containing protein-like [Arapaima gigas]
MREEQTKQQICSARHKSKVGEKRFTTGVDKFERCFCVTRALVDALPMSHEAVPRPGERERAAPFPPGCGDVPDGPHCLSGLGEILGSIADVTGESPTSSGLVRSQPQPSLLALESSKVENSELLNGHAVSLCLVASDTSTEPSRLSSPVSYKVQEKLQSSLSISGHSGRVMKGTKVISKSNHKNGSTSDDCCVHCILACLFCQFLSMCNLLLVQLSCDHCFPGPRACCHCCYCCAEDQGEDGSCACDPECGVMESSDFLEICMECCGICFPS